MINRNWIRVMAEGLKMELGDERGREIMAGAESLDETSNEEEIGLWLEGFIERADKPECESAVRQLLTACCPCDIYEEKDFIQKIRSIYAKSSSIEEFVNEIKRDEFWDKNLLLKDNIIYTTKPFACECGCNCESSFRSDLLHKCHCWQMGRYVTKPVSKIFCYCGAGFYKPLFDELFQADTRIEPVATVMAGDSQCVFAIYVPDGVKGR